MAAIIDRSTPRQAFRRLWLLGWITVLCGFYWLPEVLTRFAGHPPLVAWLLCLAFHGVGALRFGLVGWLVARCRGTDSVLMLPVVWTALEFVWPSMFPWRIGQSQLVWLPFAQIGEVTGVYGPTFIVLWGGSLLYVLLRNRVMPRGVPSHRVPLKWHIPAFAFVLGGIILFGHWRIARIEQYLEGRATLRVALVQPAFAGPERRKSCIELSRRLPEDIQLVVWPETAVGPLSMAFNDFGSAEQLAREGRPPASPLVGPRCFWLIGADSYQPSPETYFNSALLVDPAQEVLGRYHKRVLIPFGEYIPGEAWFPSLRRFSPWEVAFSSGNSSEPLVMGSDARLGVCICYEDLLAGQNRETVRAGADLLVNLTNDAWFGDSHALMQHQQLAAFRAIENRRYLLRCTSTGSTAVISPIGQTVAQAALHEPTSLIADVKTCELRTFYTRFGDVFALACLGVGAVWVGRCFMSRRAAK